MMNYLRKSTKFVIMKQIMKSLINIHNLLVNIHGILQILKHLQILSVSKETKKEYSRVNVALKQLHIISRNVGKTYLTLAINHKQLNTIISIFFLKDITVFSVILFL